MHDGPNSEGLSRKAILSQIDASLKRLGAVYVDLYIIHRWDYNTPVAETMAALHDVVKAGKARYIGASAMFAWQFQKALHVAEKKDNKAGLGSFFRKEQPIETHGDGERAQAGDIHGFGSVLVEEARGQWCNDNG